MPGGLHCIKGAAQSDGGVHGHDEVEAVLDTLEEELAVVDIDVELSLKGVMHQNTGLDVNVIVLRVPVGLEGDGYTIPALRVEVAETVSNTLYDALGQNSGLYKLRLRSHYERMNFYASQTELVL